MTNFKLILEYDGTAYHGWQKQKSERTVQGELEKALSAMTRQKIIVNGSGRTDAGVHALGQVASFHCDTRLSPENFQQGVNSLLDDDIVVRDCCLAPPDFHARYSALAKTYRYQILNRRTPSAIYRNYAWFLRKPLDINAMRQALPPITGEHDFAAFEGAGSPRSTTIREVTQITLEEKPEGFLCLEITANGFLRYMVRNIVGTLADIGSGKRAPEEMKQILAGRDRSLASPTAPPHGLFLITVKY